MKKCTKCLIEKEEVNFSKGKKNRLANWCKACHSTYSKTRYIDSDGEILKRQGEQEIVRKLKIEEKVISYLKEHPCIDCGETNLLTLDFDHQRDKEHNVAKLIWNISSWSKIQKEIDKCEVRCANCHRKRTAVQLNSWKLKFI